jgi:predicted N-acetyltransferase YhbS
VDLHASSSASALDQQLQQYVRIVTTRDRDVERVGPFVATFDPHSANPYLNYAIPDDDASPTAADVAALEDAFRRRGLPPRLEFLPAAAPAVEPALLAGGFEVEGRLAVMTCAAGEAVGLEPPPGIAIAMPKTDDDLRGMRAAQHAAFGADPGDDDEGSVRRLRDSLVAGALAVLARDEATGTIVGGGVATVPAGGVTEVAGIGVLESHRRRGIAGAITAGLARAAFAAGHSTVWLTPGDAGAHRVYARAGFADRTTMLHMSRPA